MADSERIGKYQLVRKLSEGGMAELFLAYASGPGGFRKFVAVKKILQKKGVEQAEEFVKMFLDEARITAALWHPNIGQVFELDESGGELFLAMEYIPGRNLRDVIKACDVFKRPVPQGFACAVVRAICMALHHAHHFTDQLGRPSPIIHRDVSPKNVMVTFEGSVKVIDFGIAKARARLEQTRGDRVKGTAGYLSPEQVEGAELDGRSDLFSVGVILHELLTSRRLFQGESDVEVLNRLLHDPIPAASALNPEVSPALSDVCSRALSRDRHQRFQSGKELARAIDDAAGKIIFDDDQVGAVMRELFPRELEATRALMSGHMDDSSLQQAAELLASTPRASVKEATASTRAMGQPLSIPVAVSPAKGPGPYRVLMVDDSPTMLALVKTVLSSAGYEVIGLGTPQAGLEAATRNPPDLIILDVMMPEMSGFELCRRIRENPKSHHVPIVFLSAACSLEERVESLAVGGDDFIRKPFEPPELLARVKAHLMRVARVRDRDAQPAAG